MCHRTVHPGDGGGHTGPLAPSLMGEGLPLAAISLACFEATHMLRAEQLPEGQREGKVRCCQEPAPGKRWWLQPQQE